MPSTRSRSRRNPLFSHRNLPLLLLHARARVIAPVRPLFVEHGLTEQQWRIIRAMLESGPIEPRQIVRLCGIASSTLPGILSRMEALGLVVRERMGHDQRRVLVSLTAASHALAKRMAPKIEAMYSEMEAKLGAAFTRQLYEALDHLVATLDEWNGEPDSGVADL